MIAKSFDESGGVFFGTAAVFRQPTGTSSQDQPFDLEKQGNRAFLRFKATDLDETIAERLCSQLHTHLNNHGCDTLVVDLSGVVMFRSSVLGQLVVARRAGLEIVVLNPSRHVREILRTTQIERLFKIEFGNESVKTS